MRDYATKIDNTAPNATGILTAAEDNVRFSEMENMVTTAGITLDGATDTDLTMLAQAMSRYASGGVVCQDTGGANTHVLGSVGAFILPKAYFKGMVVMFYPAGTNSGPATVNVNSIGAKQVYNSTGAALAAGDIVVNTFTMMSYDPTLNSGAGAFKLSPWSMPLRTVGDGVPVYEGLAAGRHKVRSLMAGTNITIDLVESPAASGEYKIRITSTGGGGGGTLTDGDKGDITVTAAATVWTIDNNVVDNAKAADMPANSLKGRLTTLGDPQDLNGTQAASIMPDAASGVKGMVTPNGNVNQFYNGLGGFSTPVNTFAIYPNPGCYTLLNGISNLIADIGNQKNATGVGSWFSLAGITLPAGVWQLTGNVITGPNNGLGGGEPANYTYQFLRTA